MSLAHKLFGTTSETQVEEMSKSESKSKETLKSFIAEDPQSKYTFDSERGSPESQICREGDKLSRKCIQLHMYSTQLFEAMQSQGFFCALPMDPAQTHMECQRVPQT